MLLPVASLCLADDLKMFDAKPGLWETVSTTQMEGMPAMPQISPDKLAQMPPEARARVEAMMKNAAGGPRTTTSRSCQTRESIDRGMSLNSQSECTQHAVSSTSSRIQIHYECTPPRGGHSVGDMTVERLDNGHAKGTMVMKINASGRDMTMNMSFDTKFISSDCGDVKPYTPK